MAERPPITFAYPDREHQALQAELEGAVLRVLRAGAYVLGPEVRAFEQAFASSMGVAHAVAVSSGTDALVCALLALDDSRAAASRVNDQAAEVIVPAFGFVAAAEAVVRAGARPVFVDIEPRTLGPDPEACKAAVSEHTRAAIVMHLFGQGVDLEPLRAVLGAVPIVEDAAQAIGTRLRGRQVGALDRVGTFSFFPAKSLGAAGDAGAVITADPALAQRVREARVHGASSAYRWNAPGGNYRMDAVQAAVLAVKLQALDQRLTRRRRIGQNLAQVAAAHARRPLTGAPGCDPTYAPFVLRLEGRDHVLERLRALGVDARVHYPVTLGDAPAFCAPGQDQDRWPEARRATRELLSLPCSPELSDDEVDHLARCLDEVLRG